MAKFADATAIEGSDGTFTVDLDPEWTVGTRPHGGYLLAIMGRAAITATPEHPHPLSASALYVASPELGPASVYVEALRTGRTASQVRARLVQQDRTCLEALFTLGRLDPSAPQRWVDAPPPEVAPFDECHQSSVAPRGTGIRVNMLDMVEQRIDRACFNLTGDLRGWLSFSDGADFDPLSLLYAVDSFPPSTFTLGSVGWVPTLELTAYIRALPAPGPLKLRQRSRMLSGSFVDQICEVWDSRDRVVAQATQLCAVRMKDE